MLGGGVTFYLNKSGQLVLQLRDAEISCKNLSIVGGEIPE